MAGDLGVGEIVPHEQAKNAGIGHAESLVNELGGDRQPAVPAVLDPGGLMEFKSIDEHAVVVEDRQSSSIA